MIFWDSSAIVPLLVEEPLSGAATQLARAGEGMLVWWATRVEVLSSIARRERERTLEDPEAARALLADLAKAWAEVVPADELREQATRLLRVHPLRAADALQLAAALTWAGRRPNGHRFATFDGRLADAARREGFRLPLPPV